MYNQLMDSALFGIADQKNSLVAAMGIINGIKKRYHSWLIILSMQCIKQFIINLSLKQIYVLLF